MPTDFQNYVIKDKLQGLALRKVENKEKLPLSVFIGVLGMPGKSSLLFYANVCSMVTLGKTAYMAWKEYSRAKQVTAFLHIQG